MLVEMVIFSVFIKDKIIKVLYEVSLIFVDVMVIKEIKVVIGVYVYISDVKVVNIVDFYLISWIFCLKEIKKIICLILWDLGCCIDCDDLVFRMYILLIVEGGEFIGEGIFNSNRVYGLNGVELLYFGL